MRNKQDSANEWAITRRRRRRRRRRRFFQS